MKLFAFACAISTLVICPPTEARSLRAYETSALTSVAINGQKTTFVGRVTVNNAEGKIVVEYGHDMCGYFKDLPPGTITCMAMPNIEGRFEAPIQKRENNCGSTVISGTDDQTPRDALRTEIVVMNHAGRHCEDYRPYGLEVHVTTLNPRTNKTTTYFLGK
jgi:hypothetical protein